MAEPIEYRDDVTEEIDHSPFPLGERRADDVRDFGFLMAETVDLAPLEILPTYRYYGIHDANDGNPTIADTPLNQSRCHAYQDRAKPDPLGCGHCVGYAAKHYLLCYPTVNRALHLSGSDIYHEAQRVDEWGGTQYQGTSVRAGLKVLQTKGFISSYVWTSSVETVAQWILSGRGPVLVGTSWYAGMDYPSMSNGYRVQPTGHNRGGHAYLIDGVNQSTRKARILNSWGNWGQRGRAWITWPDLQKLFDERPNAAASPVEVYRG